ncbi:MAG: hypothetical protein FWH02_08425 [Oscillospiraceae bacterium]|nr:hypothetical protein [Oscillospiraceae bacterium]
MIYETKVLLLSMAQYAIVARNKDMYDYIAVLASAENIILPPYPQE